MPHEDDELFFALDDLRSVLENQLGHAIADVESYEPNRLLNSNPEDLASYFVEKYVVSVPTILTEQIAADQKETRVDVSGRFDYGGFDDERVIIPGTEVTLHVPFDGEVELIRYTASTMSGSPPRGRISLQEVILTYRAPNAEAGRAKEYFDEQLHRLREHLDWTTRDVADWNAALPAAIRQTIEQRRQRLLANQNAVASLGYPLRARPDAPRTYAVPTKRRTVPTPPAASTLPFVPEPALDNDTYGEILTVLGNMVRVMEQGPEAFSTMGEEDLRTHFLVQLNGQFEGRASGETFHGSGSTDILLQERDRSVFIAECKFWDGPRSLTDAIDQILDYATWRDAKAALLLFNRNTDFSAVVAQVSEVIAVHPQNRGTVLKLGETSFRSRLKHRDDSAREIALTTLVYNVPTSRSVSKRLRPRRGRRP